jgi:streptogramin lyase
MARKYFREIEMEKEIKHLVGCMFICVLLGCSPMIKGKTDNISCLAPIVKIGFPPNIPGSYENSGVEYSMPSWWEPQLDISQKSIFINSTADSLIIDKDDNIWMAFSTPELSIVKFNAKKELKIYQIMDEKGNKLMIDQLLYSKSKDIWVSASNVNYYPNYYSVLYKYDKENDKFIVINDESNIITKLEKARTYDYFHRMHVLGEAKDGRIIIILNGNIVSFNPLNNSAAKLLPPQNDLVVQSIVVSDDNNIWFTVENDLSIRKLEVKTGEVINYSQPPGISISELKEYEGSRKALAIDTYGRVWLSNFGWLQKNTDGEYLWYQVIQSPVFVGESNQSPKYNYEYSVFVYPLSDGNIWFVGGMGVVQMNNQSGDWCWKAPLSGAMNEDSHKNLWIMARGNLYKYKLE